MDDLSLERKKQLYSRQLAAHTLQQRNAVCQDDQQHQTTDEAHDHAGPENEGTSTAAINGDSNSGRKGVIYSDCIAELIKMP
jgi:hypothetical protein